LVDIGGLVDYHCLILLTVMVNNSANINQKKKVLNSDSQQFRQYQPNKESFKQ
jgi:hypothetical protein